MRNIKSSLRFVRNSALLFVAASGVTYLTGCQSENSINPDNNQPTPEPSLSTASYTVHGANQGRVTNYGGGSTRAGEYVKATETFNMPAAPAIPADAKNLNETDEWGGKPVLNYGTPAVNGSYYIGADDALETGLQLNGGVTIYVAGKLKVNSLGSQGENTFVVLDGGELGFGEWVALTPNTTVYNYGDFFGNITIGENAKVYSATDITGCEVFGVNTGAEFKSKGTITAKTIRLNGEIAACAFIAEDEITLNDNGTIRTSYFEAKTLTLNASNVILDNNGLVKADRINVSNQDTRFTVEGTNAVAAAKEMNTNWYSWPKSVFAAEIAIDFEKCMINGEEKPKADFEFQVSTENQVVWVPATDCHGEYGQKPDNNPGGDEDPGDGDDEPTVEVPSNPEEPIVTPELVKVVDIESLDEEVHKGNHDHGIISATCITFGADGTAYASYHLRGNGTGDKNPNYVGEYAQKGCIEVIKYNAAGEFELGSYMISPDWDFNHLIVDGRRIVTVGNAKKLGAFVGTLPIDFEASEGVKDDFEVKELTTAEPLYGTSDKTGEQIKLGYKNAGDGNCIVRQGNYYYVATYEGYGPINLDFSKVKNEAGDVVFTKTNGSAKHIALSNNGKMAVLAHDTYDKTSSTASLYTFNAGDYSFANQLAKYDAVGTIAPVDGKNVIAMDGDELYVCLSKGGLVRVSDGKKWQRGANKQVPVNGMAFDEKYIYVANGSFISVLDKATMNEICYYHASSLKSANYIALRNGKIYVAFGEDGIQVFQLVEKEIAQK